MIEDEIGELLAREPFEPFQIKLVNGDVVQVFDPQSVTVLRDVVHVTPSDQTWVTFPHDKINSIEALLSDYRGSDYSLK